MSSLPAGPAPDADLERNASMYRAAVTGSRKRGLGPFTFMAVSLFLMVVVVVGLALTVVLADQAWRKRPRGVMIKGAVPRGPAFKKATPAAVLPPVPSAMPSGPGAFAR